MNTISYSQTRQNLKSVFDSVVNDSQPVFVKRKNGENIVILSESDYTALNETAYLLSSSANRKHLKDGLNNLEKGEFQVFDSLEDLDNAI
ncbi:type II toxin-antitoxin system prevent-host-death family antitoxin [Candidatus Gracilibacteria bacterium]|nr:type II toxin-antitoxin system prevent-host-death family antitoxin [Candidatus Gracilibacteria bacterium]